MLFNTELSFFTKFTFGLKMNLLIKNIFIYLTFLFSLTSCDLVEVKSGKLDPKSSQSIESKEIIVEVKNNLKKAPSIAESVANDLPVTVFPPSVHSWCAYTPELCFPIYDEEKPKKHKSSSQKSSNINWTMNPEQFRTINGAGNHSQNFGMAAEEGGSNDATIASAIIRTLPHRYLSDGNTPDADSLPHPRMVSNGIFNQEEPIPNEFGLSHFIFFWGQFLDHDIALTPSGPDQSFPIPPGVDALTMNGINFHRSDLLPGTGLANDNPRTQYNLATSFIDASQIYGSNDTRAQWLRTFSDGLLKTSSGNFLPFGDPSSNSPFMAGLRENPSLGMDPKKLYVAGDLRANEVLSLLSLHTLFVREHNRLAIELKQKTGSNNDELLYHLARKIVGALTQAITYREFLPALGVKLPDCSVYQSNVDPRINLLFATAGFRLGHTMVANEVVLMDQNQAISTLPLFDVFFAPYLLDEEKLAEVFLGGSRSLMEAIDNKVVSGLRNFLFGPPGSGMGLDLAMFNIHRARDHGLPSYLSTRSLFDSQSKLEASALNELIGLYNDENDIDLWVGMLSEPTLPGSAITQTIKDLLAMQFQALRDGDKFFYLKDSQFLPGGQLHAIGYDINYIHNRRLANIIADNTLLKNSDLPVSVFKVP